MKTSDCSFFTMEFISEISNLTDLNEAKTKVSNKVKEFSSAQSENVKKAMNLINNSTTVRHLVIGMSNFMLSLDGLSVVKSKSKSKSASKGKK